MTTTMNRYYRQQRRLAWARLRVTAMELRDSRQKWATRDPVAPDRLRRVWESDLRQAEEAWSEGWADLHWYRDKCAEAATAELKCKKCDGTGRYWKSNPVSPRCEHCRGSGTAGP